MPYRCRCKLPPHGALDLAALHKLATTNEHFANFAADDGWYFKFLCEYLSLIVNYCICVGSLPPVPLVQLNPNTQEKEERREDAHHDNVPSLPSLAKPLQLRMRRGVRQLLHCLALPCVGDAVS